MMAVINNSHREVRTIRGAETDGGC